MKKVAINGDAKDLIINLVDVFKKVPLLQFSESIKDLLC